MHRENVVLAGGCVVRLQLTALTSEKRFRRKGHRGTISLDCAVQYFINTLMKDTNYCAEVQLGSRYF